MKSRLCHCHTCQINETCLRNPLIGKKLCFELTSSSESFAPSSSHPSLLMRYKLTTTSTIKDESGNFHLFDHLNNAREPKVTTRHQDDNAIRFHLQLSATPPPWYYYPDDSDSPCHCYNYLSAGSLDWMSAYGTSISKYANSATRVQRTE